MIATNLPASDAKIDLYNIYLFKVAYYMTVILGRYDKDKGCFYVQRGDGTRYDYHPDRIVWKKRLECEFYRSVV